MLSIIVQSQPFHGLWKPKTQKRHDQKEMRCVEIYFWFVPANHPAQKLADTRNLDSKRVCAGLTAEDSWAQYRRCFASRRLVAASLELRPVNSNRFGFAVGTRDRNRTCNLRLRGALLYPVELRGLVRFRSRGF